MAGADRDSRLRLEVRQEAHRRARGRAQRAGRERIENYLKVFCTAELEPRKNIVTKKIADKHPDWLARLRRRAGPRLQAARARARARRARAHPRARHHRGGRDRALPARKRTPRAARLRRPDRQDARAVRPLVRRLGALQARSRHRPRADRRGAGHQPEAMEHRAHHRLGIHARRRARRTCGARCSRSATRSSRSSRSRARRRAPSTRCGASSPASSTRRSWAGVTCASTIRSAPATTVLGAVDQVFRAREIFASVTTDEAGVPPHISLPDAAPGLVELWPLIAPAERKEIEGWDAPFDTESEESPRVLLARKIAAQVKLWMARGRKAGDVLVLVRQRGPLFEAIIRALKNADDSGRRRRPAGAHRAYRGDGPDGAGRRAAAAGRRSGAGQRAQEPAVRLERGATVRAGLGPQGLAARELARQGE